MRLRRAAFSALLLLPSIVAANTLQDPRPEERGFPMARVYDDSDTGGGAQNFCVAIDPRGFLYLGNLKGVLIHDGARWSLIGSETAIYALAANKRGDVVAGGPQQLVVLDATKEGAPLLRSIVPLLPAAEREFGDVRAIQATPDGGFVILTDLRLLYYDGKTVTSLANLTHGAQSSLLMARGKVYVVTDGEEPRRLDGRKLVQADDLAALGTERIDAMVEDGDAALLAVVRSKGLVRVTGDGVTPLPGAVSAWTVKNVASSAHRLQDGRIVFRSRLGGVLLAASETQIEQAVDSTHGLPDDQVMGLAEDRDGGLWIAFNNGAARLDVATAITVFDRRVGIQGNAHDVHRIGGKLYISGSSGVGVLENGRVRRIEGIVGAAWGGLESYAGKKPLIAAAAGVFQLDGYRATLVKGTADIGAYVVERAQGFEGTLVGARSGLYLLLDAGDGYRVVGPLAGSPRYIRSIVVRLPGRAFLATVFDGVVQADFDPARPEKARFRKLGAHESDLHEAFGRINVISLGERTEVFHIDEAATPPRLVRDEPQSRALEGLGAFQSGTDSEGGLWVNTNPPRVFPAKNGVLSADALILHSFPTRNIQQIVTEPGVVWIIGETGLYRHVGIPGAGIAPPQVPRLRNVTLGDERIFDGWAREARPPASLPTDVPRLHVEFAPLSYDRGLAFQFRMDPLDTDWSDWSPRTEVEYTTLQPNQYRFRARMRGPDGRVSPEATWPFEISPPWHRSLAAQIGWAVVLILVVMAAIRLRTQSLRSEAEELTRNVEEKTRDLQEAVRELEEARLQVEEKNKKLESANALLDNVARHDALTGLANRRQFDEVFADEWGRSRRQQLPLAIGMIDLDNFKALNDSYGHPEGDEALRRVARVLKDAMQRSTDVVARYGGEEFVFVLPSTDAAGAKRLAEEIRGRIAALGIDSPGGPEAKLTASIGVATVIPTVELTPDDLIEAADRALYEAKTAGRNQVLAVEITA